MVYNVTTNSTGLIGIFDIANNVTDYWFGLSLLLGIYIMAFIVMNIKTNDPKLSFASSSFIGFIFTLLFYTSGLITNGYIFLVSIVIGAGSLIILYKD